MKIVLSTIVFLSLFLVSAISYPQEAEAPQPLEWKLSPLYRSPESEKELPSHEATLSQQWKESPAYKPLKTTPGIPEAERDAEQEKKGADVKFLLYQQKQLPIK